MKIRHSARSGQDDTKLQMTPMIDVVFQLLTFFIFTFKVLAPEGDFNVKMPAAAQSAGLPNDPQLPPMTVRLTADAGGELAGISLNDNSFGSFQELHEFVVGFIGSDSGTRDSAEVELDCDYNLRYEHVISAITAVSGSVDANGNVVRLVGKIKFAAPRSPPTGS